MAEHPTLLAESFPAGFVVLVLVIIVVAIFLRLIAGSLDKDRVEQYLRSRGCEPQEVTWEPFGPGFWGEQNDRIYRVRYRDPGGKLRQAWCKTNLWGSVYLSDDESLPIHPGKSTTEMTKVELLEKENQKLRDELERLKRLGH